MVEPWTHISENGRKLKELPREDLETLVLEMCDEYDMRNIRLLNLRVSIDKLTTCLEIAEENSRKAVLGFVIAPEAQITKPTIKSPRQKEFTMPVYGAYNSYQAGNKHIVTLRHQVETLLTRIQFSMSETQRLLAKKEKYKKLLEQRSVPEKEPFNHHVTHIKKKPKINNVTFKKAINCVKELINKEKDNDVHNLLTTAYCLLTENDVSALHSYSEIAFPVLTEMSLKELREQLSDRNAQISILNEQYKDFQRRHSRLVDDFTSLNEKMRDHIIEDDTEKNNILAQIAELDQVMQQIPERQKDITTLTEEREKLYDEIEQVHTEGLKTVDFEVEMKAKIGELEKEKISLDFTLQSLLQENGTKKTEEENIRNQIKMVQDELNESITRKNEIAARKAIINDKYNLLLKCQIEDPITLAQLAEFCKAVTLSEIEERHKQATEERQEVKKEVHDLKDECKALKRKHDVLSRAVADYRKKIAEEDSKIAKLKEKEKPHVQVVEPESSRNNSTLEKTDENKKRSQSPIISEDKPSSKLSDAKSSKLSESKSKPKPKSPSPPPQQKSPEKDEEKEKDKDKDKTSINLSPEKAEEKKVEEKKVEEKVEEKPQDKAEDKAVDEKDDTQNKESLKKSGTIHSDFESVDSDENNIVISATQTLENQTGNNSSPIPDEIADSEDEVLMSEDAIVDVKEKKSDSSEYDF